MRLPPERALKFRDRWLALTRWGPPSPGDVPAVRLGRLPIRQAIRDLSEFEEPESGLTKGDARTLLGGVVSAWPFERPRLALEADTGIGKTTAAVARCASYAREPWGEGPLLFVAHSVARVAEIVAGIREPVLAAGGEPGWVADLLGRQHLDVGRGQTWQDSRFGCPSPSDASRSGRRGRRVKAEVCERCPLQQECAIHGYLAHTAQALQARVVVTTAARIASLPDPVWKRVSCVIADEDLMPALLTEQWVFESDLKRAASYILRRQEREALREQETGKPTSGRLRALVDALPLLTGILEALASFDAREPVALVDLLPEECERYMTTEGVAALASALPRLFAKSAWGPGRSVPTELAPAEWEQRRAGWTPRQSWGRFLTALMADLATRESKRAATVRVVRLTRRSTQPRIHVVRFDERTIRHLHGRPLLLLDATLHPAIAPVLRVETERIRYHQGRTIVQTLGALHALPTLREPAGRGGAVTPEGKRLVARLAAWFAGRPGYVLCRLALRKLLEAESARYYELRRAKFITPKRERGWDAKPGTRVLVVLGCYARNGTACIREAHALRSVFLRLEGSTAGLDELERPPRHQPFVGRSKPLLYMGEPVERESRELEDRLAALIQDADRRALVTQFVGRDREGLASVLLLRGDPTIAADALVAEWDLAEALPASACGRLRKDACGITTLGKGVAHEAG